MQDERGIRRKGLVYRGLQRMSQRWAHNKNKGKEEKEEVRGGHTHSGRVDRTCAHTLPSCVLMFTHARVLTCQTYGSL